MAVPETAVDEDHFASSGQHQIRFSRQRSDVQAKPGTQTMHQ
jgi:hypothetical protein